MKCKLCNNETKNKTKNIPCCRKCRVSIKAKRRFFLDMFRATKSEIFKDLSKNVFHVKDVTSIRPENISTKKYLHNDKRFRSEFVKLHILHGRINQPKR